MKMGEIFSSTTLESQEIERALNVFGFDVKSHYQSVLDHDCLNVVVDFALAWLKAQADEAANDQYDGRNAASTHMALKIDSVCDLGYLRECWSEYCEFSGLVDFSGVDNLVSMLKHAHRTLKQVLSKFCFYVLAQEAYLASFLKAAIDALCAEPLVYYSEPCKRPEYRVETWLNTADWFRSVPYI